MKKYFKSLALLALLPIATLISSFSFAYTNVNPPTAMPVTPQYQYVQPVQQVQPVMPMQPVNPYTPYPNYSTNPYYPYQTSPYYPYYGLPNPNPFPGQSSQNMLYESNQRRPP